MDYMIDLDFFQGPFDLLLHLIKKNDMKIEDIKIEIIAEQYLSYINNLEEMNLNIASEYLVMAAELIEIKSRILLPQSNEIVEEEDDPKEKLIARLLEYKLYKEVTETFKEFESKRSLSYSKSIDDLSKYKEEEIVLFEQASVDILIDAFKNLLKRKELEKPLDTKITTKEYSVEKRNVEIKNKLKIKKQVRFEELFDIFTKDYFVVTFLSILDLSKKQELFIKQEKNFGEIILTERDD